MLRHPKLKPICSSALLSLLLKRLVISSSNSSSSSPFSSLSSSSSSLDSSATEPLSVEAIQTFPLVEVAVRADNPEGVVGRSDPLEESSHLSELDWVDPRVIGFASVYMDEPSISSFIGKYIILNLDASDDILAFDYCRPTDNVYMGRSPSKGPFFFIYACLFSDLHVSLPFDDFTMGVLRTLNVTHSKLHPNTWASIQAFRLICDMFRLSPTPSTFLSYYTSHPADPVSWLSLVSWADNTLFSPFTTSYKKFKGKFFKNFIELEGLGRFFDKDGRSNFPLYWTRNPTWFKEWSRSTPSAEELEIYSLFDNLPRTLPIQKLLTMLKSSQRWNNFYGMFTLLCVSVGQRFFNLNVFSWCINYDKRGSSVRQCHVGLLCQGSREG